MDRRQQPPTASEPDIAARVTEVRTAERSQAHQQRNEREVIA